MRTNGYDAASRTGTATAPRAAVDIATIIRHNMDPPRGFDHFRCFAGTAPVSFQSGQIHRVRIRRQCNRYLRHALHLFARCSLPKSAWAEAYYQSLRARGKSHACSLRCLAQRWLEILWKMWQDRRPYDAEKHLANLKKHGSLTLAAILNPSPATR